MYDYDGLLQSPKGYWTYDDIHVNIIWWHKNNTEHRFISAKQYVHVLQKETS